MMEANMALTKSFKELVQRRVASDADFAASLLREGIDAMLAGDIEAGKAICAITSKRRSASKGLARRRPLQPKV